MALGTHLRSESREANSLLSDGLVTHSWEGWLRYAAGPHPCPPPDTRLSDHRHIRARAWMALQPDRATFSLTPSPNPWLLVR